MRTVQFARRNGNYDYKDELTYLYNQPQTHRLLNRSMIYFMILKREPIQVIMALLENLVPISQECQQAKAVQGNG